MLTTPLNFMMGVLFKMVSLLGDFYYIGTPEAPLILLSKWPFLSDACCVSKQLIRCYFFSYYTL